MASHLFLKFLDDSGKLIKGEAHYKDYDDTWIELEGYSWSMTQRDEPQGSPADSDVAPTYAKPELFSFSKFPDSSTTKLLQMHVEERIGKSAEFHIFEELQGTEKDTGGVFKLVITLTDVRITSYKLKVDSNDKAVEMKEDWEFDYKHIKFEHKNAGANIKVFRPVDPDDEKIKGSESSSGSGGGATNAPGGAGGGGDAMGVRDFLPPLGNL